MENELTESKFLHQLASPLMIAIIHCQTLLEDAAIQTSEASTKRLQKIDKALSSMKQLLEDRRSQLHSQDATR